jgi:hypothetical protein
VYLSSFTIHRNFVDGLISLFIFFIWNFALALPQIRKAVACVRSNALLSFTVFLLIIAFPIYFSSSCPVLLGSHNFIVYKKLIKTEQQNTGHHKKIS